MAQGFIIGLGGTGAKCVEEFLHLCAAGLGPERVWTGLVDQDQANGNIGRTKQTADLYRRLQTELRRGGKNMLPSGCQLFRTELVEADGDILWCPLPEHRTNMEKIFRYPLLRPELKSLFDCLYLDEERGQPLDEGFRGRPSIGAATFLSRDFANQPFWNGLFDAFNKARAGEEVRIFLMASIFGGTGAAGLPTLARMIRSELTSRRIKSNVKIGATLMLPYFTFPKPEQDADEIVADSAAFIELAQASLVYYADVLKREEVFDNLYVVGWSPLIQLPKPSEGGPDQKNPSLLPELYGALAALRFLTSEKIEGSGQVYSVGRNHGATVTWEDIPGPAVNGNSSLADSLGQFTRFAVAFHYIYAPALQNWRPVQREAWYRRLVTQAGAKLEDREVQALIAGLNEWCSQFLTRAAEKIFSGGGSDTAVQLINANLFAEHQDISWTPAVLRQGSMSSHDKRLFSTLVYGNDRPISLNAIFQQLTYERPGLGSNDSDIASGMGVGTLIGALHTTCRA